MHPKSIRLAAGVSQMAVAFLSQTSPHSVQVFEASVEAVGPKKRAQLQRVYDEMLEKLNAKSGVK